jgi:TP901 family phage tail tape measure protein
MPKPIIQQVIFDLTAKSTKIESSLKNIISNLQSGKFSESFSKGFVNSIQKVIDRSQELRKTLSSTDDINSKSAERLSASYNKLYSDINKIVSRMENTNIKMSDLTGYDKAEFQSLIKDLETAKKKQKALIDAGAVKAQIGTPKFIDTNIQKEIVKNITDQAKVNGLIDLQTQKIKDSINAERDKVLIIEQERQKYIQLQKIIDTLSSSGARLSKSQADIAALGFSDIDTSKITKKSDALPLLKGKMATMPNFDEQIKSFTEEIVRLNQVIAQVEQYSKSLIPIIKKISDEFNIASTEVDEAQKALDTYEDQVKQAAAIDLSKHAGDVEDTAKAVGTLSKEAQNWSDTLQQSEDRDQFFKNLQSRITQIFGLANAFQLLRRFVTASWEAIKELDAAFTKIAVVTNKTTSDLWNSFSTYNKMAQQLGVTTTDAIKTSALYYQQGLETADVMVLTTETIKMAQIASMGFEEATKAMTAALRGFKLEMSDANLVTDVYSSLAAEAAVDTQDLAVAISKVASIAGNAGLSFESTSAFLTQIIETTQEAAATAGTALKTIIARFTELTKDPTSLTVEVEGEVVDANKIEAALRLAKVDLRDTEGQFRDLDTVFLELSESWDGLDRNTQRYIATTAAGSRQQSRFIAMMDDYKRTQELVAIANDSAGASEIQFAKTLDSVEAKVNKLKSSFEALIGRLVENKTVKGFLDLLNKGLQFLVSVSEKGIVSFGAMIAVIGILVKKALMGLVGLFKDTSKKLDSFKATPAILPI